MKEDYKAKLNTVLDVVYELEGLVQLALGKSTDDITFLRLIKSKLATLNSAVDDWNVEETEVVENNEVFEQTVEDDEVFETVETVENAVEPDALPDLSASSGFMRLKDKLEALKTTIPYSAESDV